jgi:hypothetical protein
VIGSLCRSPVCVPMKHWRSSTTAIMFLVFDSWMT